MTLARGLPPLRVERALRLLPDVDALGPLRAFLVSTSKPRPAVEPYRTVGKRIVQPAFALREFVPRAIAGVAEHLSALYAAAVEALEAEQRGDLNGIVRALLSAGEREERAGHFTQARVWYDHALAAAEGLHDRRPEIESLRRLGDVAIAHGSVVEGGRYFQRSFALADDERDTRGAALACLGLGGVALQEGHAQGAESWYARGLSHAADDAQLTASLFLGLAEIARERGDLEGVAQRLRVALELLQQSDDVDGISRCEDAWARLEAQLGNTDAALAHYREALASLEKGGGSIALEMDIRLNLCQLFLDCERLPDAEDEIRRAEESAIVHNLTRQLACVYVMMGKMRGHQHDETGFVFFEKAAELCRGMEPFPRLEAQVYVAYALFRKQLGNPDEARALLERAHEILEDIGTSAALRDVTVEITTLA
jgi:tetratricopeptide (TPR) repeat protein